MRLYSYIVKVSQFQLTLRMKVLPSAQNSRRCQVGGYRCMKAIGSSFVSYLYANHSCGKVNDYVALYASSAGPHFFDHPRDERLHGCCPSLKLFPLFTRHVPHEVRYAGMGWNPKYTSWHLRHFTYQNSQ